jgi:transcriptional activator for dhaKLM operon
MLSIEDSKTRWEFFQKHQWVSPEFSHSPIFQSWQRCVKQISAYDWSKPHIASGYTLASLIRRTELIINCATTIIEDTYDLLRDEKLLMIMTDDSGCVMFIIGHHELESEMEVLGIKSGCFLSEDKIGTNAVSLSIDTNMPSEVFAAEHFKRDLHHFATATAPIIDTYGKLRGTISIIQKAENYHRDNLAIAFSCAKEISLQLQIQSEQENMNRLQSAYIATLEYMDDGIISWDGENSITLISQQAEKQLKVSSNALLGRDIFKTIRFAPNIVNIIKQGKMVRRKQTTFEVNGEFIEAIVTYRCLANSTNLLFIHPTDRILEPVQQQTTDSAKYTFDNLPFVSRKMKHVMTVGRRAIKSQTPILITGEEGVGKIELAMAIHNESEYREGPFITLNCRSTNPEQLLRDVLGFDEGQGQPSKFELAHNGTLYIENIEYLDSVLQATTLKLLKTGVISRSDSQRVIPVKFQLITSTTINISEHVAQGSFGRQLYYEISAKELHIPPLRKRKEDIEHMITLLVNRYEKNHNAATITLSKEVMEMLLNFNWSGNNSQLKNIIERILLNRSANLIKLDDIPDEIKLHSKRKSNAELGIMTLDELEKQAIIQSWHIFNGHMQDMAKALNISRTTLWRKIKKYELTDMIDEP